MRILMQNAVLGLFFSWVLQSAQAANNPVGSSGPGAVDPAPLFDFKTDSDAGVLELNYRGKRLLLYAFAKNQFKPYVKALHTVSGENILRDAPADHLHHHGLMYAVRVNDINFWEETPTAGVQRSIKIVGQDTFRSAAGSPSARFSQVVHWIHPKDKTKPDSAAEVFLVETRLLSISVDESHQEVALEWKSRFELGPGHQKITLTGSNYNGLGLRFPPEFDLDGRHHNALGPVTLTGTSQNVTAATWSAITRARGTPATVVVMGDPANARGDARFFTMLNPFAYLSATQSLDRQPLIYARDDHFQVRYLVLLYPMKPDRAELEKRQAAWIKSLSVP